MNNIIQKQNNFSLKIITIISSIIFAMLLVLFYVAYMHGDGSGYATGYEFGSLLRGIFTRQPINTSIKLGSVLAVLASWDRNKSFLWAILHAILGWFYVVYFALTRNTKK